MFEYFRINIFQTKNVYPAVLAVHLTVMEKRSYKFYAPFNLTSKFVPLNIQFLIVVL